MQIGSLRPLAMLLLALTTISEIYSTQITWPEEMQKITQQSKYKHASWGLYVKNMETGQVLFDINSQQMFLPASTTKLFSVAALLHTFGDDYRFKTPLFALGRIEAGTLYGNLVLVAQGDLTMGGRQGSADTISYTKLDHIIANNVPGVILTAEDPLYAFSELAKQVRAKGIKEIYGDVLIDERLFETTHKRDMVISPLMVNENLIDLVFNPSEKGKIASLSWRPQVPGYTITNHLKTTATDSQQDIRITTNEEGKNITVEGSLPLGHKNIVRTVAIQDPKQFGRAALIQALAKEGILLKTSNQSSEPLPAPSAYKTMQPVALWVSPPLSEYAKLILKVSHNLGADLIPLLLASKKGKGSFEEGMRLLGDFVVQDVKIAKDAFVFIDGAGGDENRLTPQAEVQLLEYLKKLPKEQFEKFYACLPILGIDGSLEDFGKNLPATGKLRAKTGTGVSLNLATNQFFLTTQTLAGYIEDRQGVLLAYMLAVNNGSMSTMDDIFPIFEDLSQLSGMIYNTEIFQQR